ncbi:MAG: hypothetical protein V4850_26785 [Myxococcota bacterium]
MFLLLACAPSVPGVPVLTALAPASHAEAVSVDRFLAPTGLGATNDLLCPWARGEPVPDASLVRWVAEGRLTWRVLTVGSAVTFAGSAEPDAASASMGAARALAARCGTDISADVLVVAAPEVAFATVARAVITVTQAGLGPAWLLVDDPTPTAPTLAAVLRMYTVGVDANGVVTVERDEPAAGPDGCAVVTGADAARWDGVVAAVDDLRRRGVTEVMLATEGVVREARPMGGSPPGVRTVPVHDDVAVIPLVIPRMCAEGATGCGCMAGTLRVGNVGEAEPVKGK